MLEVDIRGLPDEKVRELQQVIDRWKREEQSADRSRTIISRKVDPSEFTPRLTKFKAPLTRALAYDE